jgi:small subunit ribosomal protein S17
MKDMNNKDIALKAAPGKRFYKGIVVSKKMEKTATVFVERVYRHALVGKVMKTKKKFHVHDEMNQSKIGDIIEFYEGRPVSKMKYMHFHKIVSNQVVSE